MSNYIFKIDKIMLILQLFDLFINYIFISNYKIQNPCFFLSNKMLTNIKKITFVIYQFTKSFDNIFNTNFNENYSKIQYFLLYKKLYLMKKNFNQRNIKIKIVNTKYQFLLSFYHFSELISNNFVDISVSKLFKKPF